MYPSISVLCTSHWFVSFYAKLTLSDRIIHVPLSISLTLSSFTSYFLTYSLHPLYVQSHKERMDVEIQDTYVNPARTFHVFVKNIFCYFINENTYC